MKKLRKTTKIILIAVAFVLLIAIDLGFLRWDNGTSSYSIIRHSLCTLQQREYYKITGDDHYCHFSSEDISGYRCWSEFDDSCG